MTTSNRIPRQSALPVILTVQLVWQWLRTHWRWWLPPVLFCLLLILLWPAEQMPRAGGDTHEYLREKFIGRRLPVYRWLLRAGGIAYPMVRFQFLFSLGAWCFLGWAVGGVPGLLAGGALAGTRHIYTWNFILLTESVSLSLAALLFGLTLLLLRRWRPVWLVLWLLVALVFLFIRESNLFILPFLVGPFLLRPWRQWLLLGTLALALMLTKQYYSSHVMYYQITQIRKMIMAHSVADPTARAYFVARGMPDFVPAFEQAATRQERHALTGSASQLGVWSRQPRVSSIYLQWMLTRGRSYQESWQAFRTYRLRSGILRHGRYQIFPQLTSPLTRAYVALGRLPIVLWLGLVLLPLGALALNRRVEPLTALAAVMVPMIYTQAFFGFMGDFYYETERHLLTATVLYRVNWLLAFAAGIEIYRTWRRRAQAASLTQHPNTMEYA